MTDFGWLIERGQPERQVPTVWWMERRYGIGDWTDDANKAIRFATREAAEAIIRRDFTPPASRGGPSARAVEHGFMSVAALRYREMNRWERLRDRPPADEAMLHFESADDPLDASDLICEGCKEDWPCDFERGRRSVPEGRESSLAAALHRERWACATDREVCEVNPDFHLAQAASLIVSPALASQRSDGRGRSERATERRGHDHR